MTDGAGGPDYGRQLAERRAEVGMTQAELANAVGTTMARLVSIEAGAALDEDLAGRLWTAIEDRRAAALEHPR